MDMSLQGIKFIIGRHVTNEKLDLAVKVTKRQHTPSKTLLVETTVIVTKKSMSL